MSPAFFTSEVLPLGVLPAHVVAVMLLEIRNAKIPENLEKGEDSFPVLFSRCAPQIFMKFDTYPTESRVVWNEGRKASILQIPESDNLIKAYAFTSSRALGKHDVTFSVRLNRVNPRGTVHNLGIGVVKDFKDAKTTDFSDFNFGTSILLVGYNSPVHRLGIFEMPVDSSRGHLYDGGQIDVVEGRSFTVSYNSRRNIIRFFGNGMCSLGHTYGYSLQDGIVYHPVVFIQSSVDAVMEVSYSRDC